MTREKSIRSADLARVLDVAESLGRPPAAPGVADLLAALARIVRCDQIFWTWLDTHKGVKIAEVYLPGPPRQVPVDEWAMHQNEHPIGSGRHGPVTSISDVLSQADFHRTWLYHECFRPAGLEHEIGVNLARTAGQVNDLALSRGPGSDFDARDHLVLKLLRPHLDAAFRRVTQPTPKLTRREAELMTYVRDGMTNAAIARHLCVTEATVSKHLEHVYTKTGAHSRTQAVRLCEGMLD